MKDERFIIQGPLVEEETLYWSNEDGWGSMDTATRFGTEVLMLPLPLEGVAVLELNDDGTVLNNYLRA
jgi:hypothetical protein